MEHKFIIHYAASTWDYYNENTCNDCDFAKRLHVGDIFKCVNCNIHTYKIKNKMYQVFEVKDKDLLSCDECIIKNLLE